mmetsp:Transcript_3291/g.10240  ORF Transcript_3291/g.10240 Transcript_3291/m.10240 type:complete len:366 (-) Transcript_3291:794-1891(-)
MFAKSGSGSAVTPLRDRSRRVSVRAVHHSIGSGPWMRVPCAIKVASAGGDGRPRMCSGIARRKSSESIAVFDTSTSLRSAPTSPTTSGSTRRSRRCPCSVHDWHPATTCGVAGAPLTMRAVSRISGSCGVDPRGSYDSTHAAPCRSPSIVIPVAGAPPPAAAGRRGSPPRAPPRVLTPGPPVDAGLAGAPYPIASVWKRFSGGACSSATAPRRGRAAAAEGPWRCACSSSVSVDWTMSSFSASPSRVRRYLSSSTVPRATMSRRMARKGLPSSTTALSVLISASRGGNVARSLFCRSRRTRRCSDAARSTDVRRLLLASRKLTSGAAERSGSAVKRFAPMMRSRRAGHRSGAGSSERAFCRRLSV